MYVKFCIMFFLHKKTTLPLIETIVVLVFVMWLSNSYFYHFTAIT